jgi:cytoskeletal protein CcmA (bactofilin family)
MEADKATVIDAEASVEGKLKGKDARVLGRFKGEIELTGRLLLGENAHVEAKVLADAAEISGEFSGDLVVRSLLLLEKARVTGMLDAQSLAVREGAQLNGSVSAGGGRKTATALATTAPTVAAPKPAVAG